MVLNQTSLVQMVCFRWHAGRGRELLLGPSVLSPSYIVSESPMTCCKATDFFPERVKTDRGAAGGFACRAESPVGTVWERVKCHFVDFREVTEW